jgi:hypothetical protein
MKYQLEVVMTRSRSKDRAYDDALMSELGLIKPETLYRRESKWVYQPAICYSVKVT